MQETMWNKWVLAFQMRGATTEYCAWRNGTATRPARCRVAVLLGLLVLGAAVAHGAVVVQEFYIPMPEEQVYTVFNKQASFGPNATNMISIFSMVVTTPDAVIYYDQWEDGYEADINNPTNSSTEVWGDGNNANGICPGFLNDPFGLPAGTAITLRNPNGFPIPRNPAEIFYDGGDRVGATKAITISRACFSEERGAAQSTVVEVISTLDHGTSYIAPVGTNVLANGMFTYVDLMVMADETNTAVVVDRDGAGPIAAFTTNINRGANGAFLVQDISKGATVTADKNIQVHMITGNRFSGQFEMRSFVLRPVELWSSKYIIPIGTANTNYPGVVYIFNTNAAPLTITRTDTTGSGTTNVPGNNGLSACTLPNSGTLLASANGSPFFAICTMDTDPTGYSGGDFDWGFAPIPFEGLTTEAVCGWGGGAQTNSEFWTGTENGSPVWITALSNTTLYVDYNGDGSRIGTTNVLALASTRVYDYVDNDQTGLRVYTTDGTLIAGAWGEDASVAASGPPFLDMGYALAPFPVISLTKTSRVVVDTAPTNTLNVGDVVEYTLRVSNRGLLPLGNIPLTDVPATIQMFYITNSTRLDGVSIPDDDPLVGDPSFFPLDNAGYTFSLRRLAQAVFTYEFLIINPGSILNTATAGEAPEVTNNIFASTPITISDSNVTEGNSGTKDMAFTVTLQSASFDDVSVYFYTSNGTATAGVDYMETNGTLRIPAGETNGVIIVKVVGDTIVEPDETFFVALTNATGDGIILDSQATGTIINDDVSFHPVVWTYNPRRDSWYGTLTISNDTAISLQAMSVWYEVKSNSAHRLRFPTGADTNTGPNWFYLDLSTQFNVALTNVGNRDAFLDPGESVVCSTNIELWGRGSVTNATPKFEDLIKIVWVSPFSPPALSSQDTSSNGGMSNSGGDSAETAFVISVTPGVDGNRLSWAGRADRLYSVLYSTNLYTTPFSVLASNILGEVPWTVYIDTNSVSRGQTFYRGESHLK